VVQYIDSEDPSDITCMQSCLNILPDQLPGYIPDIKILLNRNVNEAYTISNFRGILILTEQLIL
jgi:hypothetical protein